jgi:pilus assembly protein CpaB
MDKVKIQEIKQAEFDEAMFTETSQVIGLFARENYSVGTVLVSSMLLSDSTQIIAELHSDHASWIAPGMVAVAVPINRFSGMAYGLSRGDHVNVIATMAFIDLDTDFQTALPNYTAAVLAPGQNVLITTNPEHLGMPTVRTAEGDEKQESETEFVAGELFRNIVAQSATGEFVSPQGRAEWDSALEQAFYLVPGEPLQRPRLVTQTVMFNKLVLHMGSFPLLDAEGNQVGDTTLAQEVPAEGEEGGGEGEAVPQPTQVSKVTPPDIITLVVSPQEAVTLNYLIYMGAELTLALRPPGDESAIPTDAVSSQYLLDTYRIPVPVKVSYGFQPATYELAPPVLENDIPTPTP